MKPSPIGSVSFPVSTVVAPPGGFRNFSASGASSPLWNPEKFSVPGVTSIERNSAFSKSAFGNELGSPPPGGTSSPKNVKLEVARAGAAKSDRQAASATAPAPQQL